MSGSRPPSPVHPRIVNTSFREMAAEAQRPHQFSVPEFLGHPERHNSIGYQFPPIPGHERSSISFHPPFTTLPPPSSRPGASTNPQNYVQRSVPISKLLSDAPQEPPIRPRQISVPGPFSPGLPSPPPPGYQQYSSPVASNSPSSASLDSATSPREGPPVVSEKFNRLPSFSAPSPNLRYELNMRQQPVAARACGFGERDRRVVDPPPILELKVIDAVTGKVDSENTPYVYTTLHCTLINSMTYKDESQIEPAHPNAPATQRLMGTAVASPFSGTDETGRRGTFFVFPDLSCRNPGKYRFQFRLLIVDPLNLSVGTTSRIQSSIISEPFEVYTAKEFPGMRASSALLKALRKQGLNVAVKKGREATKKATRRPGHADDDDSSGDDGDNGADEDDQDSDDARSQVATGSKDRRIRKRRE
ncbi:hypothetical protein E4T50_11897 [Aureobasidium sp. EXF-12298]|nr:hypothetical protein E4T50_11897 [Aureobasidium sp. EXF-12298]